MESEKQALAICFIIHSLYIPHANKNSESARAYFDFTEILMAAYKEMHSSVSFSRGCGSSLVPLPSIPKAPGYYS